MSDIRDDAECKRLKESVQFAKDTLAKGLILDDDAASQIRRMIYYDEERIRKWESTKEKQSL